MKAVELKKYQIDYRSMSRPTTLSIISGQSKFHRMDDELQFLFAICSKSRKLKFDTVKKELTAVFLEKKEFEPRDEFKLSEYKKFCRIQFHKFNAGSELIVFITKIVPIVEIYRWQPLLWKYMNLNRDFFY